MSNNPITGSGRLSGRWGARREPGTERRAREGKRAWKYLTPSEVSGFKNLLFAARAIVEGQYAGRHKSPYKGSAPEFVDYREYSPGDDLRAIDWKVFARTDHHFVKLFEKETDMNCYLLLDASGSMAFNGKFSTASSPRGDLSKLEYACYLAAALLYLLIKQGDKVGLTIFDTGIRSHLPPGGTFGHLYTALNLLEQQRAGRRTAISETLRKSFGMFKRRGLLVVLSDLLDEPEEIFKSLNLYVHRGFEILLFHLFHPFEYRLPPVESANFIDSETGELLTCLPADLEKSYNQQIEEYLQTIVSLARARGIDYNFINTETPYSVVLEKYLHRRSRG